MSDIERDIAILKSAMGVELDRELAEQLEIDPSSVAAWRRRKRIPPRYLSRVVTATTPSTRITLVNAPPMRRSYLFALLSLVARGDHFSATEIDDRDDFRLALSGLRLAKVFDHLATEMPDSMTFDDIRTQFARLRGEIEQEGVVSWVDRISQITVEGRNRGRNTDLTPTS